MEYLKPTFTVAGPSRTDGCCEACVYGRGKHAEWCEKAKQENESRTSVSIA